MIGVDTREEGDDDDDEAGAAVSTVRATKPSSASSSSSFWLAVYISSQFPLSLFSFCLMCLLCGGAKNILTLMDYSAMTTTIPTPSSSSLDDDDDDERTNERTEEGNGRTKGTDQGRREEKGGEGLIELGFFCCMPHQTEKRKRI